MIFVKRLIGFVMVLLFGSCLCSCSNTTKSWYYDLYDPIEAYDEEHNKAVIDCDFDFWNYPLYDFKTGEPFTNQVLAADVIVVAYKDKEKSIINRVYVDQKRLYQVIVAHDDELNKNGVSMSFNGKVSLDYNIKYAINPDRTLIPIDELEVGTSLYAFVLCPTTAQAIFDVYSFNR